jgi:sugar phosphate isomerase/epimerase
MVPSRFSRRSMMAAMAAAPFAVRAASSIPVGLELFSVRNGLKSDLPGTLKSVAGDGYQCVEFFSPYFTWTSSQAKEIRKTLDDLGLKCYSTHNGPQSFESQGVSHAAELNHILGSRYVVWASAGEVKNLDGWKQVADKLNQASTNFGKEGLSVGYHNHQLEFTPIEGKRPMEIIASQTSKKVMLQLDVGTCVNAGSDPVEWIKTNPGRIRSIHCKDWSSSQSYSVLFGEGSSPWKKIFAAAESVGGVEFYLVEQEGSRYSELETAKLCLNAFKQIHG